MPCYGGDIGVDAAVNLREVFRHRYTGYFLEVLKFAVLLVGFLHVADRVHTLDSQGCKAYYGKFNGVKDFTDVRFFSESGFREYQENLREKYAWSSQDKKVLNP